MKTRFFETLKYYAVKMCAESAFYRDFILPYRELKVAVGGCIDKNTAIHLSKMKYYKHIPNNLKKSVINEAFG